MRRYLPDTDMTWPLPSLSSQQSRLPAQDQTSQSSSMDGGGVGLTGSTPRQLMAAGKGRVIFLSEWGLW